MDTLTGKTVFITGGAQGIGLGIAKACLKVGMRVVIADIKTEQLKVAESILDSPENVLAIDLDVRDKEAMEAAADRTEATFEKVHVVCNNAGIGGGGPAVSVTWENWHPDDGYEPARHTERDSGIRSTNRAAWGRWTHRQHRFHHRFRTTGAWRSVWGQQSRCHRTDRSPACRVSR